MEFEFEDESEAEENRLLAQLAHDISIGSPFKKQPVALTYLSPPRRGLEDEKSIADEDEELLARALLEDQAKSSEPSTVPYNLVATPLTQRGEPDMSSPQIQRILFPEEDPKEVDLLLDILRKASGEKIPSGDGPTDDAGTIAELRALVRHLQARLKFEKERADAAQDQAASYYAQRFALAVVCAASVPPLGLALLAHRYDLHELEARSDALGVMLVAIVLLLLAAIALWRKVKQQLQSEANTSDIVRRRGQELKVTPLKATLRSSSAGGASGIRRRTRRTPSSIKMETKAEAIL